MVINTAKATGFFEVLGKIFGFWKKAYKADSLVRFTETTRVEPIVLIDKRALAVPYLIDVLQSTNSLFAAYYLQAVALTCQVGDIEVGKILNKFNPERPFLESLNAGLECLVHSAPAAHDDYRLGLPDKAQIAALENYPITPALESAADELHSGFSSGTAELAEKAKQFKEESQQYTDAFTKGLRDGIKGPLHPGDSNHEKSSIDTSLGKSLSENTNLAIGRMYTVNLQKGNNEAKIPVMIRLITVECASDLLVHILSDGARFRNSSMKERWFSYKLGELKFWRDLVFCQDLIDEHKQALLKDKTGAYATILDRRAGNAVSAAVTAEPSVGTASNIVVLNRATVQELEREIGGKLDNPNVRRKVFEKSYLMIMIVLDPDHDHVTFYHRGIALGTELTISALKAANKGSGIDVGDVLKSLMAGGAPSF